MATLKKYKLKPEFFDLFKNLSGGSAFVADDAFKDRSVPQRKSLASAADVDRAEARQAAIEKLVEAGFVDVIANEFDIREKG